MGVRSMDKLAGALGGIRHYVRMKRNHKLQAYGNVAAPTIYEDGWYAGYLAALDTVDVELRRRQNAVWNGTYNG